MQKTENVIDCYNKTAQEYASQFIDELSHKHLDRILLTSFAAENRDSGRMIDLGCGPGQTTKFLADCGIKNILGTDISPVMVAAASEINPQIEFETADILKLQYPDDSFGAAIAFYSIVHFDAEQIKSAFIEIKRILADEGQFLFSFHIGDETVHLEEFLNQKVDIDFYFFEPRKITNLLTETGFEIIDAIERQPYPDVEYPSRRAYIWTKKAVR